MRTIKAHRLPTFRPPAPTQVQPQIDLPSIIHSGRKPNSVRSYGAGETVPSLFIPRAFPLRREENEILATIPSSIAALAGRTVASLGVSAAAKPFSVETKYSARCGSRAILATRISGLKL